MQLMRLGRRGLILCATASTALLCAAEAKAQGTSTPTEPAARGGELEEVVVTARRREERLQDVPVAVTAFTPERLKQAQVTTARQLVGMVPSLNISSGNQRDFQRFAIRGQGATVGAGESVTKVDSFGTSREMSSATCLIRKLPNETPASPRWQFEIE